MNTLETLTFDNRYAALPEGFHAHLDPTPLSDPHLVSFNPRAAELIDLHPDEGRRDAFVHLLGGNTSLPGSRPLAMGYAGHQFGYWVPQLGDGRALLLGQVRNRQGELWDLHLKGAGRTPYSRDGDGRAVLRSTVREYLCSEAMAGLGIPTSRSLGMVGSEEPVRRERIERGAALLRLAPSHVRFGSFEFFYYRRKFRSLKLLADHVIDEHFPALREAENPYAALLKEATARTARLVARWQLVGFAHGVLNTDNMSILGITLDYGPFGFLDDYDPGFVCNHSDHEGRYAFDRQPEIGLWNLSCLAQALLPLIDPEDGEAAAERAQAILGGYRRVFRDAYRTGMAGKLGLREMGKEDMGLAEGLLEIMAEQRVDYTNLFRALGEVRSADAGGDRAARDQFLDRAAFDRWADGYRARLRCDGETDTARRVRMNRANPKYVLRNHLAQRAIERAEARDYGEIERLLTLLAHPFDEQPEHQRYAAPPLENERGIVVSCSS
ncbi:protein adenylyltransferase SelO [Endothiovibrio diazotrophicus]